MDTRKNASKIAALLVLLAVVLALPALPALAEVAQTHYTTLRGDPPGTLKSAISSADTSFQLWSATPIAPHPTEGNPKLTAKVTFSVASATAALACGLYHKAPDGTYTFLGVASITTCTASALQRDGVRYPTESYPEWDTRGAPYYDLRVDNISTGNVTVVPWVYGSRSRGKD